MLRPYFSILFFALAYTLQATICIISIVVKGHNKPYVCLSECNNYSIYACKFKLFTQISQILIRFCWFISTKDNIS